MDFYSASGISLLWVCFFQTIAISWFFGAERFCDCIEEMIGFRPGKFWSVCWVFLAPAVMFSIFIFYCVQYEPVKYGGSYEYPLWAERIGLCICLSSMLWIPGYAIYYVLSQPNTILENLRQGLTPSMGKMRANRQKAAAATAAQRQQQQEHQSCRQTIPMSESKVVLICNNTR
ncbi:hypothetical protein B566_EDAN015726 [Ephemera danica]|nr:hypothetical protein B566_EDAN015726 [Ephemera danica]